VVVSTPLDPFLSLRALADYSGLSVRKLRDYLDDATHLLPAYQVGGKLLVRRSEFDGWIAAFRRRGRPDVDRIVSDVLRDLR
jgi:excisionase family DNA binding protein